MTTLPYPSYTDSRWDTPQLIYGAEQPVPVIAYSDRLRYEDRLAARRARSVAGVDQPQTVAGWIAWLVAYYQNPIDLRYIKAGANRTTGHPYYILGFDYA